MAKGQPRLVVLLHGWLGLPGAFGRLPKILSARGHDVLPLFHRFDSLPRSLTVEDLAERLEKHLVRERRGRPTVLIAHSMGGLVALTWMLRHHAAKGRRPPVERLVTFGTPRHGVWLQPFARVFVDRGLVPGTALARQMRAPNPFLWDLAWSEFEHASLLPPIISGAGLLRRASPVSALVGGRESDGVVPTVCSQPNAVFISHKGARASRPHREEESPGSGRDGRGPGTRATLPPRTFRVFRGRAHSGPRGLYAGLKSDGEDERMALLLGAVEGGSGIGLAGERDDGGMLCQTACIVRHARGERAELVMGTRDGAAEAPVARHKEGLSLFLLRVMKPGEVTVEAGVRVGGQERSLRGAGVERDVGGGQVLYLDFLS